MHRLRCSSIFNISGACPHAYELMGKRDPDIAKSCDAVEDWYRKIENSDDIKTAKSGHMSNTTNSNHGTMVKNSTFDTLETVDHIILENSEANCEKDTDIASSHTDTAKTYSRQNILLENVCVDIAMKKFIQKSSWSQTIPKDWYSTVDLNYHADVVKRRRRLVYGNTAIAEEEFIHLDIFLLRTGKSDLLLTLIENGFQKLRSPGICDDVLVDTTLAVRLKVKFLKILLKKCKNQNIRSYCIRWCTQSCILAYVTFHSDLEIFRLVLEIYKKIYKAKFFPNRDFEFLSQVLCRCLEYGRFDFTYLALHHMENMRIVSGNMQVSYPAIKRLVRHRRIDVLEAMMMFKGFAGCVDKVLTYSILCGEILVLS